ncbi:hypothetical protein [Streptomyces sp. A012304]|uniref:nSTAND1 domain-containing NTPase n=1 Tax=Streptomyces sp. A012304 TaxID=375446 RepID=UPI0022313F35|nr:hypothetical protein [Streptomyces sp. A012304]GKQ36408.1 hypothetical protein ALMP_29510 [Streptomyces sp. A012304]
MPRRERPLGEGDGPLLRFAADLRRLREKAGSPSYRELASRVHYSVTTLSDAAGGRRLPSLAVTLAYVRACRGDAEEWERRWQAVAAEIALDAAAKTEDVDGPEKGSAPYAGLTPFQPEDAGRFFGRERLVEDLWIRLLSERLVTVFGASGAGKSSVLRAGLVARLNAERQAWPVLMFTPTAHPLEECAIRLASALGTTPGQAYEELSADRRGLHRLVRQALALEPDTTELVVIVDQFEEIFTLCRSSEERTAFIDALITAARTTSSRCRIVLGVRADFYAHCTSHPEFVDVLRDAQLPIGPMTVDELRRAIVQPAVQDGYTVESALLAEVVTQAHGQVGVLPLLSHALLETWRRRSGNRLTLTGFQAAGGIEGALSQTAEAVYAALRPEQQRTARNLFVRLTALGEGTEDTKRRIDRTELDVEGESGTDRKPGRGDVEAVVERLVRARLLTLDHDTVEITHEALIRGWPRLREWLAQDREGLRTHRQLTESAQAWEALGRDSGALYRGARLARAREWADKASDTMLTASEHAFLQAGADAEADEQSAARRRARRLRQLIASLTVLLVLALVAVVQAVDAQRTAALQRDLATSQKLAAEAEAIRATHPALAAQLSLAAYRLAPTVAARSSLLSTFAAPYAARLTTHRNHVNAVAFAPGGRILATASHDRTAELWNVADPRHPRRLAVLAAHTANVNSAAFAPDGRLLATAGWDRTVRLWDVSDPRAPRQSAVLTGHTDTVNAVAFSPDGRTLASVSSDRTVRLWNTAQPRRPGKPVVLKAHTDGVIWAVFSPDGNSLVTTGWEGTVRLWRVSGPDRQPTALAVLDRRAGPGLTAAFAPSGRTVATAGQNRQIRLWDVSDARRPRGLATLRGHTDDVRSVAFSPDGRTLASAGADRTVRLWDITAPRRPGGKELTSLIGHTDAAVSVAFSPDGRSLATTSDDHTARLWDLSRPLLVGHTNSVYGMAFASDGRVSATAGDDGTARLWDMSRPGPPRSLATLTGHTRTVNAAVFGGEGRILATASADHTARLWDVSDRRHPRTLATLRGHSDAVNTVAFSEDGRLLVTAETAGTAWLWSAADPARPVRITALRGHSDTVNAAAFAPGGRMVATASGDHTVRLWDVAQQGRQRRLSTLTGHDDAVKAVAFSTDGRYLATASADHTTRLWDVSEPRRPRVLTVLTGHSDTVYAVALSRDAGLLATVGADGTARVWDIRDIGEPRRLVTLTGHTGVLFAVAFGPDGHTLATAGQDRTARLWELDEEKVAAWVCASAYPRITRSLWESYLPGTDYRPPCPT